MSDFRREFIAFSLAQRVLRFGDFVTKSGRRTPYFFNAGLFNTGASLDRFAQFYAKTITASRVRYDMLFGPAYKGIPLVAAVAIALARGSDDAASRDVAFAFNRKEAKDHGEGGRVIGAALAGRVLIIDDVMTAGTAVGESVELIRAAGATPAGVAVSLDRMERGSGERSAVQEIQDRYGMPVIAIATLDDLLRFLQDEPDMRQNMEAISAYRRLYGACQHA